MAMAYGIQLHQKALITNRGRKTDHRATNAIASLILTPRLH